MSRCVGGYLNPFLRTGRLGLFLCLLGFSPWMLAQELGREVAVAPEAFVRATPVPPWFQRQTVPPAGRLSDPAVIRLADSHFRVADVPVVVVHRAIQANEAAFLTDIGQYQISFQPEFQRVELRGLKIHRGGAILDKLNGATIRFHHAERGAEQGIYSGMAQALAVVQDVRPGDTLELI